MAEPQDVTVLLHKWSQGDQEALGILTPIVYRELHRIASGYLSRENASHTLQPTALINEAYMRLARQDGFDWKNRAQFYGIAANHMRQILVDHARRKLARKRGSGAKAVALDAAMEIGSAPDELVVALDDALREFAAIDELKARLIELRYFGGLTLEEVSDVLGIAVNTARKYERLAHAWLGQYLRAPA